MADQSQRQEMNAAIRAQRERHNVPRSLTGEGPPPPVARAAPAPRPEPAPTPEPPAKKRLLSRFFGK